MELNSRSSKVISLVSGGENQLFMKVFKTGPMFLSCKINSVWPQVLSKRNAFDQLQKTDTAITPFTPLHI